MICYLIHLHQVLHLYFAPLKVFLYCLNQQGLIFLLPTSIKEKEIVWIIGVYVNYAWRTLVAHDEVLNVEKFFGFLTYKYRENKSFLGRIEWLEQ